ncbi:activator-dependent family glycosyltransferase [Streptomyces tendae]|uniref:activator-dependent family glycosyltransferase n=1 Tax=Streptomyces tendae TaxID=1932 RepID=UPI003414B6F8
MRVLFTVYAAKTHFYNMVPVAWAFRAAGHEVCVASGPELVEAITRTGLTAVAVGDADEMRQDSGPGSQEGPDEQVTSGSSWRDLNAGITETRPEALTWDYVLGTFTIACSMHYEYATGGQTMLDDLVEFATAWEPDLVIWDAMTFAGPVAARASGAAHARMLFGIDYIGRMYGEYARLLAAQPPERRDDPLGDWITGRLARFGCRPDAGDTAGTAAGDGTVGGELAREMMTGQWTIDPTPAWLQLPLDLPLLPVRYVPYNGPTAIPEWVLAPPQRPRVCLSMGMTAREVLGGDLFSVSDMLASMAELDIEIVATLDAGQLDPAVSLPANVHIVDFVPLNELLPTCSAIIHHGGFGTLGNAMVHGVPNIIAPGRYWDEIRFGERIEERGAGLILDYRQMSGDGLKSGIDGETLKSMVGRVLEVPSYRHNTGRIQDELRVTPSPGDLVQQLEKLVADTVCRVPPGHRS